MPVNSHSKIAFVGTGIMGSAVAGHILDAGYDVTVTNRTKAKAEGLLARGAKWADTPAEAAKDADVLYTDVWASMGQEGESSQRKLVFEGYQINDAVMAAAHPGAMVQHCLPAHRGEEITAAVFESHADEIFDEAENRLHAQKAVLYLLMK